jgi:hypothetical protein
MPDAEADRDGPRTQLDVARLGRLADRRSLRFVLGVFGVITGLAVLAIAAQVIGRRVGQGADDANILWAFGASRSTLLGDGLLGVDAAVALRSFVAGGVAVALSPLTPLGPVRPVYPTPGVAFDWTVLGLG